MYLDSRFYPAISLRRYRPLLCPELSRSRRFVAVKHIECDQPDHHGEEVVDRFDPMRKVAASMSETIETLRALKPGPYLSSEKYFEKF